MYCSTSITIHLLRGIAAFALLATIWLVPLNPFVCALLFGVSLVLLRGCPMCWLMGLFNKLYSRTLSASKTKGVHS